MAANDDLIGLNDAELRKPDPRIASLIADALGTAQSVLVDKRKATAAKAVAD